MVCSFSVAVNRKHDSSSGEPQKETTWFRVSVWGRQAEACHKFLQKGRQVLVEGRLAPDRATGNPRAFTRQDGTPGASYDVTAELVRFLGSASGDEPPEHARKADAERALEAEIPF